MIYPEKKSYPKPVPLKFLIFCLALLCDWSLQINLLKYFNIPKLLKNSSKSGAKIPSGVQYLKVHYLKSLIEDKTIPDYFYPHALEGVTMEKQETTRKKKRFDMKRSFRRISAVIATMAFTTGLAACGSSQSTAPSANKATSSVTAPQGWKKFTSKDLGYSVYFPGVPEKDTYKDPTGAYARYSTVNDKDHINYAVSVTKFTRKQVEDSKGFNDAQKRKVLTNVARLLQIDKYSFTTVDGHMAISYTGHDSEDSSVIMRREVVYSSAGLYGLESFGTSSSEYKQFVDTFRLSEDTQE